MNRFSTLFLALILILSVSSTMSWADEKTTDIEKTAWQNIFSDAVGHYPINIDQTNTNPRQKGKLDETQNWSFDAGLQRFIMSHASYAIGNTAPPNQEPLSRLQFPFNTWWLELELRRTCPRWSIGTRAGLSVDHNSDGRMKDTDWLRTESPETVTSYSESACRVEESYLFREDVDVNISDWLRLPPSIEIRPLFAFEYQRLNLMAHDGVLWETGHYPLDIQDGPIAHEDIIESGGIEGDFIHFRQDYYLFLIGLRGSCDLVKPSKYITIRLRGEADWGPALAYYEDHHLIRQGDMFSACKGRGNAIYFLTGIEMVFAKSVTFGISMDYTQIKTTTATVTHWNIPMHENESWDEGVKMWSDQTSLTAHVTYTF